MKELLLYSKYRYKWLDKALPGTTKKVIVKKLLLDQFLMTPQLLVIFYAGENLCLHSIQFDFNKNGKSF